MLYYIIEDENKSAYIKKIKGATDATYHELKNQCFKILGIFGREDYANIWKDFYNGEINKDQLNKFLDSK